MKIPCSSCNQRLEIPDELAGQTIECPACNASLVVPSLATPPPVTPQVEVATPQAASIKNSKLPIPKWAIASVAGIVVLTASFIMFFSDPAVKTDGESQQSAPVPEVKPVEPVAEAAKPEPPPAKAPDIDIWTAIVKGNIEAVKKHLAAGADVNAASELWSGMTPLHLAAEGGHNEIAELLIAKGADLNVKDQNQFVGGTPLDWAIKRGKNETADLLRKRGGKTVAELRAADTNRKISKPQANRALLEAAKNGNIHTAIAAVKQAITDGANVNAKDAGWADMTALHYAAQKGHKEIIELLIANGVNVNAKNLTDKTPLDWANTFNRPELAALLRKHGGKTGEELKPEKKNKERTEAPKTFSEIDALIRKSEGQSKDNFEIVKRYLSSGADVNKRNNAGGTILHVAVAKSDKKLVNLLLSKGADINVINKRGITPISIAIKFRKAEIIDLLRKHGGMTSEELKAEGK